MSTLDVRRRDAAPTGTPLGAGLAAACLVIGAAGNLGQSLVWQLQGGRPDTVEEQLAWAADHGTAYAVACLLGTLAVPFMAVGFWAAARLLARRARIAGFVGGALLLLGMWGFQAVQVAETIQLAAMFDGAAGAEQAAVWMDTLDESPLLLVFGVPFILLTPIGFLVLTIGALVKAAFPRWIAGSWLGFAVLDFGVGETGPVDPHWLYLIGAVGLALHLLRDRTRAWVAPEQSSDSADHPALP